MALRFGVEQFESTWLTTPTCVNKVVPTDDLCISSITARVVFFGSPAFTNLKMVIYDETTTTLLATSDTVYNTDIYSDVFNISDLCFEFTGLELDKDTAYTVTLQADTYTYVADTSFVGLVLNFPLDEEAAPSNLQAIRQREFCLQYTGRQKGEWELVTQIFEDCELDADVYRAEFTAKEEVRIDKISTRLAFYGNPVFTNLKMEIRSLANAIVATSSTQLNTADIVEHDFQVSDVGFQFSKPILLPKGARFTILIQSDSYTYVASTSWVGWVLDYPVPGPCTKVSRPEHSSPYIRYMGEAI